MSSKGGIMITGASTGIGEYCAVELAKQGYRVFAGVRKQEDGDRLAREGGENVIPVLVDVAEEQQVNAAAKTVREALGGEALVGLFNNAGITVNGPLEYVPLGDVRRQLEVNVVGQVAVTQAFLPMLRESKGRILITGSTSGFFVMPMMIPYSMSKYAMEAMADGLRRELRPMGIEVSLLQAGGVKTRIWEKGIGETERFLENAPPEMMDHYGWLVNALRKLAPRMEKQAHDPKVVLDAVEHALTARHPKTRYVMGANARPQKWIAKLPDRVVDRLVAKMTGG